eukprot:scaffold1484_cov241-Pinguiococcus_pyrenoidosus.AAC.4
MQEGAVRLHRSRSQQRQTPGVAGSTEAGKRDGPPSLERPGADAGFRHQAPNGHTADGLQSF